MPAANSPHNRRMQVALYPHRFYDPITRRWHRARYVARLEQIAANGRPFQITGAPELREVDVDAVQLTAAHVQSSPAQSGPMPLDLGDAAELVRDTTSTSAAEGTGEACGDDPAWGARRLT